MQLSRGKLSKVQQPQLITSAGQESAATIINNPAIISPKNNQVLVQNTRRSIQFGGQNDSTEKTTEAKSKSRVREFGKNIINMFGFNRKTASKTD